MTTETELLYNVRRTLSRRNALRPRKMPQGLWRGKRKKLQNY